jgi:hypothetical protein
MGREESLAGLADGYTVYVPLEFYCDRAPAQFDSHAMFSRLLYNPTLLLEVTRPTTQTYIYRGHQSPSCISG